MEDLRKYYPHKKESGGIVMAIHGYDPVSQWVMPKPITKDNSQGVPPEKRADQPNSIYDIINGGKVNSGEKSIWSILQDNKKNTDNVVIPRRLESPGAANAAQNPADSESGEYKVKQGDNLWNIAKKALAQSDQPADDKAILNLVSEIARINNIENPDLIYPDQKLKIPNLKEKDNVKPEDSNQQKDNNQQIDKGQEISTII